MGKRLLIHKVFVLFIKICIHILHVISFTLQQHWAKKIGERLPNIRRRISRNERKTHGVVTKGRPGRKKKNVHVIVPSIPDGETVETLETQKKELIEMYRKGSNQLSKVEVLMDNTFPIRRQTVLVEDTRVWQLLQQYPFFRDDKGVQVSN